MSKYILSPNAQKSLLNIKAYSSKQFGERQTKIYLQSIQSKFGDLADNPEIGRIRDEIKTGYLSVLIGSHVIFYRISESHIDIIDVLHQSMEPLLHLYSD